MFLHGEAKSTRSLWKQTKKTLDLIYRSKWDTEE